MAEFEKTEFEFPDEIEAKQSRVGSKKVEIDDTPEIEIVDDTPEKDRGRGVMETPPEEVTEEELSKYSDKKLQDRLAKLGRGYHDERRAKEAALREKDEAFKLAQSIINENKQLKGSLSTSQEALLEQAKRTVSSEIDEAKREYKAAYESGDSDALLEAQDKLTAAKIKADKVNNFRPTPLQDDRNTVQTAQTAQAQDPKAERWRTNNPWFGQDREMTGYALALHEKLVLEDGLDPSSDEYYKRLNGRIRHLFSDKFSSDGDDANTSQRQKGNVVAPATRSTAPRKIVLNATQVQLAKRLGVPLELYARKVAEEMRK